MNQARGQRTILALATYDFTTMYTKLAQPELKQRLCGLIRSLFNRMEGQLTPKLLIRKDNTFTWVRRASPTPDTATAYTANQICEMVTFLIENTFLQFGEAIYHQGIGLPMGIAPAGQMANLFCFTYELQFLHRLVSAGSEQNLPLARLVASNLTRYIDDLLAINIDIEPWLYLPNGIYPRNFLELSLADSGRAVPYLDLHIKQTKKLGLHCALFDKRLDEMYEGINVIRYPHSTSLLARKAHLAIITSRLQHLRRVISTPDTFCYEAALVLHRMIRQGHKLSALRPRVFSFFKKHLLW